MPSGQNMSHKRKAAESSWPVEAGTPQWAEDSDLSKRSRQVGSSEGPCSQLVSRTGPQLYCRSRMRNSRLPRPGPHLWGGRCRPVHLHPPVSPTLKAGKLISLVSVCQPAVVHRLVIEAFALLGSKNPGSPKTNQSAAVCASAFL